MPAVGFRRLSLLIAFALLADGTADAAVDGTVLNRTTGRPQAGVTVTLLRLQQGMEPAGTATTDAQGRFRLDAEPQGPALLQASHAGVNYNRMLPPGSPTTGLEVEVFDSSTRRGDARVAQHMILLEPGHDGIAVNESVIFQNDSKLTYNDPANGTYQFYAAEGATDLRVNAVSGQGMPLTRPAEKTREPNVYRVQFAIKPGGETRFDIAYQLPATSMSSFKTRLLHGGGPVRLVAPRGVTIKGGNVTAMGNEPRTQATVYDVKGDTLDVSIQGTGTLRPPNAGGSEEEAGPEITQALPKIYRRRDLILALASAILILGFALLYRARRPA